MAFPYQKKLFHGVGCGLCLMLTAVLIPLAVQAYELSGDITLEGRFFLQEPADPDQDKNDNSVALAPELYHEFSSGSSCTIQPFARYDSGDDRRTHWDLREANYLYVGDEVEIKAGVSKVFWGATEFVHLVDIINQTDLVDALDGEEKLGQPMIHVSVPKDWGVVDAFVLPWFRERTYPGEPGRLRPLVVDTDQAVYESGAEQGHTDFALRYSNTFGDADVGIDQFIGTSREPVLLLGGEMTDPVLIPYYQQISQTGLDVQMVAGSWLLKGEAFYRSGQGDSFAATTFGFEYTFVGIADSQMDIGIIGEYIYDGRNNQTATPYDNDLMAGMRLAVNDAAGTELLAGMIKDVELSSMFFSLEASRRLTDRLKIAADAAFFNDIDEQDTVYGLRDDDFVKLKLLYFF
jgi:hypothetical protein